MRRGLLVGALILWCASARAAPRYAILLGNNQGASTRGQLLYAEHDVNRIATTLVELGGFTPERVTVLKGAGLAAFREAFARAEAALRSNPREGDSLLLVYYSGHSDPEGLELGAEQLTYDQLREMLHRSPASVKVAVVDACHAGTLTRVKGGLPVRVRGLALPAPRAKGMVLVASTAMGEPAQESSQLAGSFFTHHLEAALRGAADTDRDGQVTLTEAFRYTSEQTVLTTAHTTAGPQHPTYEVQMAGRGEVVLTDLRQAEAWLMLPPVPDGTYLVRGRHGLLAEVRGAPLSLMLGLPADDYHVEQLSGRDRSEADVVLSKGKSTGPPSFTRVAAQEVTLKGGAGRVELAAGVAMLNAPLPSTTLGIGPRLALRVELSRLIAVRATFDFRAGGFQAALAKYTGYAFSGGLALLFRPLDGPWRVELGPEAGYGSSLQQFEDGSRYAAGVASFRATASLARAFGRWRIILDASAGVSRFRLNDSLVVAPSEVVSLSAAVAL